MAIYSLNESEYENNNEYYDESYDEYDREDSIREACEYILDMLESTAADRNGVKLNKKANEDRQQAEVYDKHASSLGGFARRRSDYLNSRADNRSRLANDIHVNANNKNDRSEAYRKYRKMGLNNEESKYSAKHDDIANAVRSRRQDIKRDADSSSSGAHNVHTTPDEIRNAYRRKKGSTTWN